jgi:NDP-sugar pyrophosphorylase family protein
MIEKTLNIVIPMAGQGSRFIKAGYVLPKPLVNIEGKSMIQRVIENIKPEINHKFIFICREDQYLRHNLNELFATHTNNNFSVITLSSSTQGAVCTILRAIKEINNEEDLLIANSDQIVDININEFIKYSRESLADGVIMTFPSTHPKWSFAKLGKDGNVCEVAEKKVISNKATVGIYFFKKGIDFVNHSFSMIEKEIRVNNEFYVCPVYNEIILKKGIVKIADISEDQMHGLGTPEDLTDYLKYLKNLPK